MAELMESPILFVVMVAASYWIVRRCRVPLTVASRLGMGLVALVLTLVAEFGFVLWLRGISIAQYLAARDPVSGTVYYLMLGVMTLLPLFIDRTR